ncbi:MAG TPA: ABC transporter substrate-binding protein [Stellaceae bacterium]|nr:ABC transporter substrate-binding protein [Stellaceae bacterium]
MKRRDLLLLPAAAAIARNPALAAVETPRIGFVEVGSRQENRSLLDAFRETLSALGWTDGSNIAIVERSAGERTEQLPGIIEKLIASGIAVLVTVGSPATLAASRASADTPIVLVGVDDPVGLGAVESLEQPGGNITGFSLSSTELIAQRLRLLQELVPGLRRLAVIVRADPGLEQKLQDIRRNAAEIGIEPLMLEAATGTALRLAFARLRAERSEALYVASGPLGPVKRAQLIALAFEARLPAIYSFRVFALEGGLMSFSADYGDLFRRAAGYVAKILTGTKPVDLPIEPPRKFALTINLKTAGALGLEIPSAILARADEVIE